MLYMFCFVVFICNTCRTCLCWYNKIQHNNDKNGISSRLIAQPATARGKGSMGTKGGRKGEGEIEGMDTG